MPLKIVLTSSSGRVGENHNRQNIRREIQDKRRNQKRQRNAQAFRAAAVQICTTNLARLLVFITEIQATAATGFVVGCRLYRIPARQSVDFIINPMLRNRDRSPNQHNRQRKHQIKRRAKFNLRHRRELDIRHQSGIKNTSTIIAWRSLTKTRVANRSAGYARSRTNAV